MSRWLAILIPFVLSAQAATYYIDYNSGSDANLGATKAAPWKRHPYMRGWIGSYSHVAGDSFIFKGGVTWPTTCFTMSIAASGTVGNHDYYGVDPTWYTGGAWTRPIFDGQHTAPSGSHIISISTKQHITIDNIEIKGHLTTSADAYFDASIWLYDVANITMTNLWVHDWQLHPSITKDEAHGGIIALFGSYGMTNVVLTHSTISNEENAARNSGLAVRQIGTIKYCTIHDVPSAVLFTGDFHHNTLYNINYGSGAGFASSNNYHRNVVYVDGWNGVLSETTPAYVYNNKVYDWYSGAPPIYPNVSADDSTCYVYNNVVYGVQSIGQGCVSIDPYAYGALGYRGTVYVFNNTFRVYETNFPAVRIVPRNGEGYYLKYFGGFNNHVIGTGTYLVGGGTPQSSANFTNLIQTPAAAALQGYMLETVYYPTNTGATIDVGSSVWGSSNVFRIDYNGLYRTNYDIGAYEYAGNNPVTPPIPPDPPLLTWPMEAEDMLIDSPFVDGGTYVSQAIQTTDPANGGLLRAFFDIGTNGTYRLFANVEAETTASDSIFVQIDAEPETPTHIWDVQTLTTNYEQRYVSWRGAGTYDNPQFGTNTWYLESGQHLLYIRGREANMGLDWFMLEYVPESTNNGVRLTLATLSTNESAGTITFTVERVGTTAVEASVDYVTETFTAFPHKHFYPAQGTLTFGIGETSKTFDVRIIDNAVVDDDLTFNVWLFNAVDTTVLTPAVCPVTVENTDVVYSTWSNWTTP